MNTERKNGSPNAEQNEGDAREPRRRKGKCKWFNVVKGWGFITPDDGGQEVFVHQHVIHMDGFRSLGENEEVEFECEETSKGFEATIVTGPQGAYCIGSQRVVGRKRTRKIRCYNCGEYGNHVAAKCKLGPMPKRCHHCKSEDHLIAECPHRFNKNNVIILDDERSKDREHSEKQLSSGIAGLSLSEESGDVKRGESNA
ncbi:hypothetical protein PGB90_001535 [Kerria lacca]